MIIESKARRSPSTHERARARPQCLPVSVGRHGQSRGTEIKGAFEDMKGRCAICKWVNVKSRTVANHALLVLLRCGCKERQNASAIDGLLHEKPAHGKI